MVTKKLQQNQVTARAFADFKELATSGKAGNFMCGDGLVEAT
jgi:hypothetical protein